MTRHLIVSPRMCPVYPAHGHDQFIARLRGLISPWLHDEEVAHGA